MLNELNVRIISILAHYNALKYQDRLLLNIFLTIFLKYAHTLYITFKHPALNLKRVYVLYYVMYINVNTLKRLKCR